MIRILKKILPLAARTEGAARRHSKAHAWGCRLLLPESVCLLLAMSASAESLQTTTVEPDVDAVSDSSALQGSWYLGKKGLTYCPKRPTNLWISIRLQTRFNDYPG